MNFDHSLLLPIYIPIILGFAVRLTGYFPADSAPVIRQLCLKITIPMLVFVNMAQLDTAMMAQVLPLTLSLPVWMGLLWIAAIGVTQLPVFRRKRFEVILTMVQFNIGFIGWAVCDIALGNEGLVRSLMFATLYWPAAFIFAFLTHLVLDRSSEGLRTALGALKLSVPVLAAFVAGLTLALLGWNLPAAVMDPLAAFGRMTTPLILFGVGLTLTFRAHWGELAVLLPLRLAMGLGTALLVVLAIGGLDDLSRRAILIVSLMPVGANTLIVGDIMGLDEKWLSSAIALSTLLALVTIPLSLVFLA